MAIFSTTNLRRIGAQKVAVGSASYGAGMSAPSHKHAGEEIIAVVGDNGKFTSRRKEVEAATGDLIFFEPGEYEKNTSSRILAVKRRDLFSSTRTLAMGVT